MKNLFVLFYLCCAFTAHAQKVPVDSVGILIRDLQTQIASLKIAQVSKPYIDSAITFALTRLPVDSLSITPGQGTIDVTKNRLGTNNNVINLFPMLQRTKDTELRLEVIEKKLVTGFNIQGTAK
jgi:hypothetical protein